MKLSTKLTLEYMSAFIMAIWFIVLLAISLFNMVKDKGDLLIRAHIIFDSINKRHPDYIFGFIENMDKSDDKSSTRLVHDPPIATCIQIKDDYIRMEVPKKSKNLIRTAIMMKEIWKKEEDRIEVVTTEDENITKKELKEVLTTEDENLTKEELQKLRKKQKKAHIQILRNNQAYLRIPANKIVNKCIYNKLLTLLSDTLAMIIVIKLLEAINLSYSMDEKNIIVHSLESMKYLHIITWSIYAITNRYFINSMDVDSVCDSFNSLCSRNGIVFKKEDKKYEYEDDQGNIKEYRYDNERWLTLISVTDKKDPKRKAWQEAPGLGNQYREAMDLFDEAVSHIEASSLAVGVLCGVYVLSCVVLTTIVMFKEVIYESPTIMLSVVIGVTTSVTAAYTTICVNIGISYIKSIKAYKLCDNMNARRCIVTNSSVKQNMRCIAEFRLIKEITPYIEIVKQNMGCIAEFRFIIATTPYIEIVKQNMMFFPGFRLIRAITYDIEIVMKLYAIYYTRCVICPNEDMYIPLSTSPTHVPVHRRKRKVVKTE